MPMANAKIKTLGLKRFILVLAVLVAYAAYAIHSYGVKQGLSVTALTWAFFIFATPIADAGFLLAFPIRLITGLRMLYTQIGVWIAGLFLVAGYLLFSAGTFDKTPLLGLFHKIITMPWPLGLILVLSAVGTYVSILFDDDVVDIATAKDKKTRLRDERRRLYYTVLIFAITVVLYVVLLRATDTHINIF